MWYASLWDKILAFGLAQAVRPVLWSSSQWYSWVACYTDVGALQCYIQAWAPLACHALWVRQYIKLLEALTTEEINAQTFIQLLFTTKAPTTWDAHTVKVHWPLQFSALRRLNSQNVLTFHGRMHSSEHFIGSEWVDTHRHIVWSYTEKECREQSFVSKIFANIPPWHVAWPVSLV